MDYFGGEKFNAEFAEAGSSSRMMLAKMPDTSFAPLSQHHGYTEEEQANILRNSVCQKVVLAFRNYLAEKWNSCRKDYTEGKSCAEC